MQSPEQMRGAGQSPHSHGSNTPISARHPATVLPPIVAPPDGMNVAEGPHSASSAGRPPFSRTSSISSEQGLPKVHHILNPTSTAHEKTSASPTPDNASSQRPFPPHPLLRGPSNERLTPTSSSPCGPPPLRVPAPLSNPTGTIDAKKSPFLPITSQSHPMGAIPPGPGVNPVLGPRQGHPPAHMTGFSGPGPWRGGADAGGSQSRTGSPASTHSSYGQPSTTQGSPRSEYSSVSHTPHHQYPPHQSQQPPPPPPPPQHQQHHHHHQHHHRQQHQHQHPAGGHPAHHGAQYAQHVQAQYAGGPYPGMMPNSSHMQQTFVLDLEQGPITVPVDVTAASKTADEKRKRNAGASARFRQRRKEKEREATHTISKLESQVRELENDREFYRMERDYFREVAMKHEESKASLVQRMPSPGPLSERKRQSSLGSSSRGEGGLSPSSAGGVEYRESGDRGSDDGRILRRRISEYEQEAQAHQQYQQQQHHHHLSQHQRHSPHGSEHLHHHAQQQHSAAYFPHQPAAAGPPSHHQRHPALPPSPISVNQNNGQYSLPTPDSRTGTPGAAPMQQPVAIPQSMRSSHYESANRSAPPVALETRWAAPS